jgi:MFS family permease
MSVYTLGPVVGRSEYSAIARIALIPRPVAPAIGPAIGGYMTEAIGWRYLFISVAGLSAITAVGGIFLYHETYAPVIRRRVMLEGSASGRTGESQSHLPQILETRNRLNYLFTNLTRPLVLLTTSFILFALSSYMALWVHFMYRFFGYC